VKSGMTIIPVSTVDEVLAHALTGPLSPIEWTEPADVVKPATADDGRDVDSVITH